MVSDQAMVIFHNESITTERNEGISDPSKMFEAEYSPIIYLCDFGTMVTSLIEKTLDMASSDAGSVHICAGIFASLAGKSFNDPRMMSLANMPDSHRLPEMVSALSREGDSALRGQTSPGGAGIVWFDVGSKTATVFGGSLEPDDFTGFRIMATTLGETLNEQRALHYKSAANAGMF